MANVVCGILLAGLLMGGCAREVEAPVVKGKGAEEWFEVGVGGKKLRVQVMVSVEEMSRGLMGRRELAEDEGMFFVYEREQGLAFWMRNTLVALDIGFFTRDGVLREVYPMYPLDETSVKSVRRDLVYALEVRQGWFARNGVKVGEKVNLEELGAAVRVRGGKD